MSGSKGKSLLGALEMAVAFRNESLNIDMVIPDNLNNSSCLTQPYIRRG